MTAHSSHDIRRGLWLGLLGIVIFAVTLPMTRLAVGTPGAPGGGGAIKLADLLLLGAMLCAAVGYGYGARPSQQMRAEHVICWANGWTR